MTALELFNKTLNELRLSFHKYGKLSDSNAKLDEISKLIALELYELRNGRSDIKDMLRDHESHSKNIVTDLQNIFQKAASNKMFLASNGVPIFGNTPKLELDAEDNEFAASVLKLIHQSISRIREEGQRFDLINESFGHFVRNNFRNNVEDAQYMTPQEVVDLMTSMSLERIRNGSLPHNKNFIVCDPCCGVGSFLTSFYTGALHGNVLKKNNIRILAQDKVQRMIRLTRLNFNLFEADNFDICTGNSLVGTSNLDQYQGKVDLILTNPPFGAGFSKEELRNESPDKYPLLSDIFNNDARINSEILFIDRCISLLKEGGEILAVVPDSVISSSGIPEVLRYRIIHDKNLTLLSVIELPTVTFAQAGTRTKTSILHLKKSAPGKSGHVFIGRSIDLGFEVSTRKGATIKVSKGNNDLPALTQAYHRSLGQDSIKSSYRVVSESPSAVMVEYQHFLKNPWTPSHYDSSLYRELDKLENNKDFALVPLGELAEFITRERKKEKIEENARCISILHIVNSDMIDYRGLLEYEPKYPGIVCKPGDLLFSKINPRIPRSIVVPDFGFPVTCSSEFEIIRSKSEWSNYALRSLLMMPSVQLQINQLTSGTSSSHNRIKSPELAKIQIPVIKKGSPRYEAFIQLLEKEMKDHEAINKLAIKRFQNNKKLDSLIG